MIDNCYIEKTYKTSHQDPWKCNLMRIPCTYIEPNAAGAAEMNAIIQWCLDKDIPTLARTPSGGIKVGIKGLGFYLNGNRHGVELIYNGKFQFRVQFRHLMCNKDGHGSHLTGSKAFTIFRKHCEKFGIDIMSMWNPKKGKEIKKEIESPIRWLNPIYKDKIVEHAYHIDGNNMWFGQMIKEFPIFKEPVLELYKEKCTTKDKNRKQDIKDIFTHTLGYCQSLDSVKMHAGLAQLAKAGINGCNHEIMRLAQYYKDKVIAINTDGIWLACKPNIDHLGDGIGEFKLDHKDCKFRAISANKYEFIEKDGTYKPVLSGLCKLDYIEPDRSKWHWGDIYKKDLTSIIYYKWNAKLNRLEEHHE